MLRNLQPRFLQGLTAAELKSVLATAQQIRFAGKSVITNQDNSAEHLYLLVSGRARYFYLTEAGQKVILFWIPPGEMFGLATLLPTLTGYALSAETVRNSLMLVWNRTQIRNLALQCPKLLENTCAIAMDYLITYRTAHISMICSSARERLANLLVSLARGIGQQAAKGIELKIRNEELANEAHVTVFTASRLLKEWQRQGMLQKSRGKILLRSPELLLRNAA